MEHAVSRENSLQQILLVALNLATACLIAGCVIASVFVMTNPFAERNRKKMAVDAMQQLMPNATGFRLIPGYSSWYLAQCNTVPLGYVLGIQTKGYGGAMKILAAVDTNDILINYTILSHNETPGLGDGAEKPKFRNQFKGKSASQLVVVKSHDPDKIDAMSGATITSRAVTNAIRNELFALQGYQKSLAAQ